MGCVYLSWSDSIPITPISERYTYRIWIGFFLFPANLQGNPRPPTGRPCPTLLCQLSSCREGQGIWCPLQGGGKVRLPFPRTCKPTIRSLYSWPRPTLLCQLCYAPLSRELAREPIAYQQVASPYLTVPISALPPLPTHLTPTPSIPRRLA